MLFDEHDAPEILSSRNLLFISDSTYTSITILHEDNDSGTSFAYAAFAGRRVVTVSSFSAAALAPWRELDGWMDGRTQAY